MKNANSHSLAAVARKCALAGDDVIFSVTKVPSLPIMDDAGVDIIGLS